MMGQDERNSQELGSLRQQYGLLDEKIARLRRALAIEVGVTQKFQIEEQLKEAEAERAEVERKMGVLEEGGVVGPNPQPPEPVQGTRPVAPGGNAAGNDYSQGVNATLLLLAGLVAIVITAVAALVLRYVLQIQNDTTFLLVLVIVLSFVLFVVSRPAGKEYLRSLGKVLGMFK